MHGTATRLLILNGGKLFGRKVYSHDDIVKMGSLEMNATLTIQYITAIYR
jgi:hypothetical protein